MAERVPLRRQIGVLVATAGIIVGGLGLLPQASATSSVDTDRIAGADRYATAVEISKSTFGATTVTDAVLASGEGFADALAAGYLAGQVGGPILLVQRNELPSITSLELSRLEVDTVWLVGGTAAISDAVKAQLEANYTVKRVSGIDRYETAKAAATQQGFTPGNYKNEKAAIVASGENFPDALAGGSVAYGAKLPLLLSQRLSLPTATCDALKALAIEQVLLLGGEAALAPTVQTSIATCLGASATVERVAGASRAGTAARLAEVALSGLGFKNTEVVVASGNTFADALAGATYAGRNRFPTLLLGSVPPETAAFVKTHNATISDITALGGTAAVSNDDLASLASTARCTPATTTTTSQPGLPTLVPGSTTTTTAPSSTSSTVQTCTTPTTGASTTTTAGGATTAPPTTACPLPLLC